MRYLLPILTLAGSTIIGPAYANVVVTEQTISWPDDGWYQVQDAKTWTTRCEGGQSCEVDVGTYNVINLTTGERFDGIVVAGSETDTSTGITVSDRTISWPSDGYYQVQEVGTWVTVCEGGQSCEVELGLYNVINLSTGERFEGIVVGESGTGVSTSVTVSDSTISWPNDGYYQVQEASTWSTVCEGGESCEVASGTYNVINLTTGERFEDILVADSGTGGSTGVTVSDSTISWPNDGYYQVQEASTWTTVCEGGQSCEVEPGTYNVINLTTGARFENIQVVGISEDVIREKLEDVITNLRLAAYEFMFDYNRQYNLGVLAQSALNCSNNFTQLPFVEGIWPFMQVNCYNPEMESFTDDFKFTVDGFDIFYVDFTQLPDRAIFVEQEDCYLSMISRGSAGDCQLRSIIVQVEGRYIVFHNAYDAGGFVPGGFLITENREETLPRSNATSASSPVDGLCKIAPIIAGINDPIISDGSFTIRPKPSASSCVEQLEWAAEALASAIN